jgi:hypothetical protein
MGISVCCGSDALQIRDTALKVELDLHALCQFIFMGNLFDAILARAKAVTATALGQIGNQLGDEFSAITLSRQWLFLVAGTLAFSLLLVRVLDAMLLRCKLAVAR